LHRANRLKFRARNFGANQKPIAGTYLFAAVYGFERVERDRLFLAAHRQRTERATRHADGKRADAPAPEVFIPSSPRGPLRNPDQRRCQR
jgi:hypothetical protein